ncbi:MAG: hypothetical protein K0U98_06065 [Deltaproteobacteria bacterium]|nr:hypothetical protein [Deltaproteobacteria bacterium]
MTDARQAGASSPALTWPNSYPDLCPPAEATPADGTVLRLVRNDPPRPDDFRAWSVENGRVAKSKPCQSCAVSVFEQIDDVRKMQRRVPSQRVKPVAAAELKPEMGVTKLTPKRYQSHRSWWIPDGLDPSPDFQVVAPPLKTEGA